MPQSSFSLSLQFRQRRGKWCPLVFPHIQLFHCLTLWAESFFSVCVSLFDGLAASCSIVFGKLEWKHVENLKFKFYLKKQLFYYCDSNCWLISSPLVVFLRIVHLVSIANNPSKNCVEKIKTLEEMKIIVKGRDFLLFVEQHLLIIELMNLLWYQLVYT